MSERIRFTIPTKTISNAERSESYVWAYTIFDPRSDSFETIFGTCPPADAEALKKGLMEGTARLYAE